MPRRKASDASLPGKARTRSGCLTCRQRKVKCDEKRPACQRCIDSSYECQNGIVLKWQDDFAGRGIAFGRSGVWKKYDRGGSSPNNASSPSEVLCENVQWCSMPYIQSHHFINGTVENFDVLISDASDYQPPLFENSPDSAVQVTTLSSPRSKYLSNFKTLSYTPLVHELAQFTDFKGAPVSHLLQYYVEGLCPLTTPNHSSNSPFATIVLPFALNASPDAFRSLLALSACHRSKSDLSWEQTALNLKAGMLQFLRKRLGSKNSLDVSRDPEVLTITMIMCLYEIINECDEQWVVYLRGARDIIRIRKQLPEPSTEMAVFEPVFSFAERFFAFQDVLGRTACGGVPNFKSYTWNTAIHEIDLWMGCSPELFQILGSITDLINLKRKDSASASQESFILEVASLKYQLENLIQTVHGDDDDIILQSAELKRLAATLYLHCTLYDAFPSTPFVVKRVQEILQSVMWCLENGLEASLTWPVFVAAVELDPLDDMITLENGPISGRAFILNSLAAMSTATVGNLERTKAVIIDVWQRRDLAQLQNTDEVKDHRSDWEIYVAPASLNLSLA